MATFFAENDLGFWMLPKPPKMKQWERIPRLVKPVPWGYEIDLETQMDDLSLRNNMLGVKLGESSLHTIDATPLYNQILHESALKAANQMPDVILNRDKNEPPNSIKHHN